jgi:hypothetical protein
VEKESFEKGDDELKKMMSESMGGIGWWSVIFRSNFPTGWLLALALTPWIFFLAIFFFFDHPFKMVRRSVQHQMVSVISECS